MRKTTNTVLPILFHLLALALPSYAQQAGSAERPHRIPRASTRIDIDGRADEPAWEQALALELAYEVLPGENTPAPVRTLCLLTYDSDNFYVAFRAWDPEPGAVRARYNDRDSLNPSTDDMVIIDLDTFNDERRSYTFNCNPLGVQLDATRTLGSSDAGWDGIWDSAGRITDWGWEVEIAIPFSTLQFQQTDGPQVWGLQAQRGYPRGRRTWFWLTPEDRNNDCFLCQTAKIEGFEGVSPGCNIQLAPTLTAMRTDRRSAIPAGQFETESQKAEIGLTARWGVTPNISLLGALNPDFSQVEADAAQLDINRPFALYFPEKRPFFTESQQYFVTPLHAVHTRMIADPQWGLKLTGKEGANSFGFFAARDEITNLVFPGSTSSRSASLARANTSAVLRYNRDIMGNSTLGLLVTDREGDDYHNRLLGADGTLRFSDSDTFVFQVMGSSTRYDAATARQFDQPLDTFSGYAMRLRYERNTRDWRFYTMYEDRNSLFRADLGFITRAGHRWYVLGAEKVWWGQADDFFSKMYLGCEFDESFNVGGDGGLIWRDFEVWFAGEGPMQSFFHVRYSRLRSNYRELSSAINFLFGEFQFQPSSWIELGASYNCGDEIDYVHAADASVLMLVPWANVRLGRHLQLDLSHQLRRLTVAGGRLFLANQTEARFVYQFDERTFVRAILQLTDIRRNQALYEDRVDEMSRDLFMQLLFSYKINPQTVIFVGYSSGYQGNQDFGLVQADRTFFIKLGYAWML